MQVHLFTHLYFLAFYNENALEVKIKKRKKKKKTLTMTISTSSLLFWKCLYIVLLLKAKSCIKYFNLHFPLLYASVCLKYTFGLLFCFFSVSFSFSVSDSLPLSSELYEANQQTHIKSNYPMKANDIFISFLQLGTSKNKFH